MVANTDHQPTTRKNFTCKGWNFDDLVGQHGLIAVPRVSALTGRDILSRTIGLHEKNGVPLVIQDFHKHPDWPTDLFDPDWLISCGLQEISVRNIHNGEDKTIFLSDFILTSRKISPFTQVDEPERLYGKDAPCPDRWKEWLSSGAIPRRLLEDSQSNLLTNLPDEQRVETLMCYLGVGDTFTPIHKDLCASSGQNLMCFTENGGSSFWFMTDSSSTRELTNHFLALNKVLDHETHIMSLEEVADTATHVPIYVIEQRIGDLVLVPPRSYHQVVNAGGFTIKTSWSRVTLQGLQTALYHELPLYRRVCRLETYRIKSTIHHTVLRWTKNVLGQDCKSDQNSVLMAKSLAIILSAFDSVLLDEYCPRYAQLETVQPKCSLATEPEVQCDFCGADIFQSFFYCGDCVQEAPNEIADGFILCPGCYVEGRTCKCGSLKPSQWRAFETLLAARRAAHAALHSYWERNTTLKQVPLREERDLLHTSSKKGIFSACILLVERRKAFKPKDALRKCSTGSLSHDIPLDEWVYCKECHRARCFSHMLYAYDMHAVQILHALTDEKSVHERHKTSKINYHQKWELYEKQEKEGKQPEDIQLSDLAQTFTTCKPLHPGFVRPGWYDENIEIIRSTEGNLDHLKQKYYNLTASVSDRSRPLSKVSGGGNENRKRLFLDCVMLETQTRGVDSRNAASSRSATSEVSDGVEDESTNCSLFDSPIQSTQEGVRKRRKTTSHALPSNSEFARALDSNIQTTDTKTIIHRHRLKQPENNDRRKRSAEETHLNGTPPSSQEL